MVLVDPAQMAKPPLESTIIGNAGGIFYFVIRGEAIG